MTSCETMRRPWGHYVVLADTSTFKIKEIVVQPGQRLSKQRHQHRREHWHVLQGVAQVELAGQQQRLSKGHSVDIPPCTWHRLANVGDTAVTLIEIQTGGYFGEDDIQRAEDDYGRTS
jgi:mannose-6-phosphate isomerase